MTKKLVFTLATLFFFVTGAYSQFLVPGGSVGTSSDPNLVEFTTTTYAGFFLRASSGTSQFRLRGNVAQFAFDNAAGDTELARIGYNSGNNLVEITHNNNGGMVFTSGSNVLLFNDAGNLGIGTFSPQSKLSVNGKMESEEVQVKQDVADYVFYEDYELMPLNQLEKYISENGHLPRIQTQEDVDNNRGMVNIGELSVSLMEKVEELTLHLIEMNKRIEALEKENKLLKEKK